MLYQLFQKIKIIKIIHLSYSNDKKTNSIIISSFFSKIKKINCFFINYYLYFCFCFFV
ncbi:hypothetical protein IC575_002381 [Cucumis melo]